MFAVACVASHGGRVTSPWGAKIYGKYKFYWY